MSPAVHVTQLTKRYARSFSNNGILALDGVDLQVAPGEIFGLLGPNGAGKTTLVKILLSIVKATQGTASLFGVPVQHPDARLRIGYLPENHQFPDYLTAEQMLDLYGRMAGVSQHDRQQRIPRLLETVRMTAWRETKIKKFSKGMMQRLGLAQALLNDADLILLDEPTDGVDPVGRREIRDVLIDLREAGKTLFLNSHLLSEVEQVCTRIAILNKGRVVREGTVDALTAIERVYEVTSTPIPDALRRRLGHHIEYVEAQGSPEAALHRYRVLAADRPTLNTVLDQLRQAEVLLEAVHPVRQSLEEYFIDVVSEEE